MAFTFAGQYNPDALLATGSSGATLLPSLTVNVYTVGTTTAVTLYTSRTKGTTTANPVTTDVKGNLTFYANPGPYDIVFTPPGGSQQRITVTVPVDPAELAATYPQVVAVVAATGTSATDAANIASAVTTAGSGGSVYFPKGTYVADNLAPLSGQRWWGPATIQRPAASTNSVIVGSDLTGFVLDGLTIDGNRSGAGSATQNSTVLLIRATRCQVRRCTVQNVPISNIGVDIRGGVQSVVAGNTFYNCGIGVQVGLVYGSTDACDGNAVTGNTFDTIDYNPVFVTENEWSQGSVAVSYLVTNTLIAHNTMKNWGDAGIESGSGCIGTTIVGNVLGGNASANDGILIRDNRDATVSGNTIRNLTKATARGISIVNLNDYTQRATVSGNTVQNVGLNGIQVPNQTNACFDLEFIGNTVDGAVAGSGITIDKATGVSVTGCISRNNGHDGLTIGGAAAVNNMTVSGGRYLNNASASSTNYNGIGVGTATALSICGICAYDTRAGGSKTQGYGIALGGAAVVNAVITNNSLVGNSVGTLYNGGATTSTIANNV